jgi:hypothetical protein
MDVCSLDSTPSVLPTQGRYYRWGPTPSTNPWIKGFVQQKVMRSWVWVLGWIKRWFPKAFSLETMALRDRSTRIWMSTLKFFLCESTNSRRGSDVPEDGESSGWLVWSLHGWVWESPHGFEREEERGGSNGWVEKENPSFWFEGIYTPAKVIGSTDTGPVLPRVQENWDSEALSVIPTWRRFYRRGSVVPTLRRFNREEPKFQQWALIGTSDLVSVVPPIKQILRNDWEFRWDLLEKRNYGHVEHPTWCRNYRGCRYFRYQVGTTDRAEMIKKKFEISNDSDNSIWIKV